MNRILFLFFLLGPVIKITSQSRSGEESHLFAAHLMGEQAAACYPRRQENRCRKADNIWKELFRIVRAFLIFC